MIWYAVGWFVAMVTIAAAVARSVGTGSTPRERAMTQLRPRSPGPGPLPRMRQTTAGRTYQDEINLTRKGTPE